MERSIVCRDSIVWIVEFNGYDPVAQFGIVMEVPEQALAGLRVGVCLDGALFKYRLIEAVGIA